MQPRYGACGTVDIEEVPDSLFPIRCLNPCVTMRQEFVHFCTSQQRPMRIGQYALPAEDSDQDGLQSGKTAFRTLLREPRCVLSTDDSSASEAQVPLAACNRTVYSLGRKLQAASRLPECSLSDALPRDGVGLTACVLSALQTSDQPLVHARFFKRGGSKLQHRVGLSSTVICGCAF